MQPTIPQSDSSLEPSSNSSSTAEHHSPAEGSPADLSQTDVSPAKASHSEGDNSRGSRSGSSQSAGALDSEGSDSPRTPRPPSAEATGITTDQARLALRRVKDPELNLNIVDLGLVYDVQVEGADVRIDMSLTSPGCPSGPEIMGDAEQQLKTLPGVGDVTVNLVWTPPWTPDRIEPRVRAYMGF